MLGRVRLDFGILLVTTFTLKDLLEVRFRSRVDVVDDDSSDDQYIRDRVQSVDLLLHWRKYGNEGGRKDEGRLVLFLVKREGFDKYDDRLGLLCFHMIQGKVKHREQANKQPSNQQKCKKPTTNSHSHMQQQ